MHGTSPAEVPIPVTVIGGLVTLAGPDSLPMGASPRNYDWDYLVGGGQTRPGLTSVYTQVDAEVGPKGPGAASSTTWSNPDNILANDGAFSSVALSGTPSSGSLAESTGSTSVGSSGVPWSFPASIFGSSGSAEASFTGLTTNYPGSGTATTTATQNVPGSSSSTSSILSGLPSVVTGHSVLLTVNASATISSTGGGSGGTVIFEYSTDGVVWNGISQTSSSGSSTASVSVSVANINQLQLRVYCVAWVGSIGGTSSASGTINSWSAAVATGVVQSSASLTASFPGATLPANASITGIQVTLGASTSATAAQLSIQLVNGNTLIGTEKTASAASAVTLGGSADSWGASLTSIPSVQIIASSAGTTIVSLNALVVTIFYNVPGSGTVPNSLTASSFSFNFSGTDSISGIQIALTGLSNVPANVQAQLISNGVLIGTPKTVAMPQANSTMLLGSVSDAWGASLTPAMLNSLSFGVQLEALSSGFNTASVFVDYVSFTVGISTGTSNFQYIGTFTNQDGVVRNLSVDANGNLWVENVSLAPGAITLERTGIALNSLVSSSENAGVNYLAFSDGYKGIDMPLQYTPSWIDRITQVGPGAAPTFTAQQATSDTFAIVNITQPAQKSDPGDPGHLQAVLQSQGPTSTSPGNVVTIFYADAFVYGQDTDLQTAFNSGYAVYVYMSSLPSPFVNGVYQVTSIGMAIPPGGAYQRWYFTYNVTSSAYSFIGGPDTATGYYNRTLATLTTSVPVPNALPGGNITVSGSTVVAWNASWRITQTPNASQMAITGSAVSASGVATLNYAVTGASAAPAGGQLVTITGTLNAGGALNVANATIISSTGGSTGSFTINVSVVSYAFEAENGLATTAGTIFNFDPGAALVGTATNPIYGTGTGGSLIFNSSGLFIDPGTYQGTVGFITRNGLWTFPAPPVVFTVPANSTTLQVTNLPIGPPNVVSRYIAITEAGQNGVPGGNFFVIPAPVDFYSQNVKYTATATVVNDNSSTSANLFFTGAVLYNSEAIDQYGYNLFNCIEIGDPGWTLGYGGRQWYGLCINKVQNFNNLSFDGGYNPGSQLLPLGWASSDVYGYLVSSPKFGNAYYIKNTTASTLTTAGLISQTAYQDANKVAIIQPNTAYSVRLTASNPSGITVGSLVIALVNAGVILGSYTVALSSLKSNLDIYTGSLLATGLLTVPSGTTLEVYASGLGAGADVLVDRFDIYPTEIPVLTTTVYGSYAGLPEQVDSITGTVGFSSENQQPINGAMVLYDTFYGLKAWNGKAPGSSLYSLQKASNLEPAQWDEPEVAQRSGGAIGPMAFDLGEQWFIGASRNGLYLFVGGQPGKINQEIYQVWDAINWASAQTMWVKVDLDARRIYIGVPMSTPNFWLPNAPTVANPTSPNVILMCDFKGLDSGEEVRQYPEMHTTMFGALNAIDMRRKWSIWQIPAPYANLVQGPSDVELYICNGRGNSKVYQLDPSATKDDGLTIDSLYTTAGLPGLGKRAEMPQLGKNRVRMGYMVATLESAGNIQATLYANRLPGPKTPPVASWNIPGGFTPGKPYNDDAEASLNFAATRTFLELRQNDGLGGFSLSNLVMFGQKDPWNTMRGRSG